MATHDPTDDDEPMEKYLLEKITLHTLNGFTAEQFGEAVERFFYERRNGNFEEEQVVTGDGVQGLIESAWERIRGHEDVEIRGSEDVEIRGSEDAEIRDDADGKGAEDINTLHSSLAGGKRIFTSEERLWQTITGHQRDLNRIPGKEFELLVVIAQHGPEGVLQSTATRITGQDKHSVPARTDRLRQKGYITKVSVVADKTRTSLLRLTKHTPNDPTPTVMGSGGMLHYDVLFDRTVALLQQNGNLMSIDDLVKEVEMRDKMRRKMFIRSCVRLARVGCTRLLRCRVQDEDGNPVMLKGKKREKTTRAIQLLREPTAEDRAVWSNFRGRTGPHREMKKPSRRQKKPGDDDEEEEEEDDDDDDDDEGDDEDAEGETDDEILMPLDPSLTTTPTTPSRKSGRVRKPSSQAKTSIDYSQMFDDDEEDSEHNAEHEVDESAGLETYESAGDLGGNANAAANTTPDVILSGEPQTTISDQATIPDQTKDSGQPVFEKRMRRKSAKALEADALRAVGEPMLTEPVQGYDPMEDSDAQPSEAEEEHVDVDIDGMNVTKAALRTPDLEDESAKMEPGRKKRESSKKDKSSAQKKREPIVKKREIPPEEYEEYEEYAQITAERLVRIEMKKKYLKRTASMAHLDDFEPESPNKVPRIDNLTCDPVNPDPDSNQVINFALPTALVANLKTSILARQSPGVYINPPGARNLKLENYVQRGRPRNAIIAVVKSARLRNFEWWGNDEGPRFAPKASKRRTARIGLGLKQGWMRLDEDEEGEGRRKRQRRRGGSVDLGGDEAGEESSPAAAAASGSTLRRTGRVTKRYSIRDDVGSDLDEESGSDAADEVEAQGESIEEAKKELEALQRKRGRPRNKDRIRIRVLERRIEAAAEAMKGVAEDGDGDGHASEVEADAVDFEIAQPTTARSTIAKDDTATTEVASAEEEPDVVATTPPLSQSIHAERIIHLQSAATIQEPQVTAADDRHHSNSFPPTQTPSTPAAVESRNSHDTTMLSAQPFLAGLNTFRLAEGGAAVAPVTKSHLSTTPGAATAHSDIADCGPPISGLTPAEEAQTSAFGVEEQTRAGAAPGDDQTQLTVAPSDDATQVGPQANNAKKPQMSPISLDSVPPGDTPSQQAAASTTIATSTPRPESWRKKRAKNIEEMFTKDYVDAHPFEYFYHRGKGMYSRGQTVTQEYVDAHPEEHFKTVGKRLIRLPADVSRRLQEMRMTPTTSSRPVPKANSVDPPQDAQPIHTREYVEAHPNETFYHRGGGHWYPGLPPPGSGYKTGVRGPGAKEWKENALLELEESENVEKTTSSRPFLTAGTEGISAQRSIQRGSVLPDGDVEMADQEHAEDVEKDDEEYDNDNAVPRQDEDPSNTSLGEPTYSSSGNRVFFPMDLSTAVVVRRSVNQKQNDAVPARRERLQTVSKPANETQSSKKASQTRRTNKGPRGPARGSKASRDLLRRAQRVWPFAISPQAAEIPAEASTLLMHPAQSFHSPSGTFGTATEIVADSPSTVQIGGRFLRDRSSLAKLPQFLDDDFCKTPGLVVKLKIRNLQSVLPPDTAVESGLFSTNEASATVPMSRVTGKPKRAYSRRSKKVTFRVNDSDGDEFKDDGEGEDDDDVSEDVDVSAGEDDDAAEGEDVAVARPERRKRSRGVNGELRHRDMASGPAFKDADRLVIAFALVAAICGGLRVEGINWTLIAHALGFRYDGGFLRRRWDHYKRTRKADVDKLRAAIHEPFLAAYEDDDFPRVDFSNLNNTDWPALFNWVQETVVPHVQLQPKSEGPTVPDLLRTRKETEARFEIQEPASLYELRLDEYFVTITEQSRRNLITKYTYGNALPGEVRPKDQLSQDMTLLRSWVRAVAVTKQYNYHPEAAAQKLRQFSPEQLQQVTSDMIENKTFSQERKSRMLPGRNYQISNECLQNFRRWPPRPDERRFLRFVAQAWKNINAHFQTNETLNLVPSASDPEYLVLTNMVAQGMIRIASVYPPVRTDYDAPFPKLSPWGYCGPTYETKKVDMSRLKFPIVYTKLHASYRSHHNLVSHHPIPLSPAREFAGETGVRIPFWVDIHGNLIDDIWDMVLRSVLHLVVFRSGITIEGIEMAHGRKLWGWEVEMVLGWMEVVGIAKRCGGGGEGWRAGEWWYAAFSAEVAGWKAPGVED